MAAIRAATVPVSAAKRAVTVVPIFAPKVKGNIFFKLNTPAPAKERPVKSLWMNFEP